MVLWAMNTAYMNSIFFKERQEHPFFCSCTPCVRHSHLLCHKYLGQKDCVVRGKDASLPEVHSFQIHVITCYVRFKPFRKFFMNRIICRAYTFKPLRSTVYSVYLLKKAENRWLGALVEIFIAFPPAQSKVAASIRSFPQVSAETLTRDWFSRTGAC